NWSERPTSLGATLPRRLQPVDEPRQAPTAKLGQEGFDGFGEVERGDQLRRHTEVRRKRPRIGHRSQHKICRPVEHRSVEHHPNVFFSMSSSPVTKGRGPGSDLSGARTEEIEEVAIGVTEVN